MCVCVFLFAHVCDPSECPAVIIIIIIIMSLFNEDNIFSKYTNLTYGPLKSKNTNST